MYKDVYVKIHVFIYIFKDTYIFKGCGIIYLKFSYHLAYLLINYQSNVQYKNQKGRNSSKGGKCFNFSSKTLHNDIMIFTSIYILMQI